MKRKLMFLWALLIGVCAQVSAQTWTWTGETPTSGNSYYLFADLNDGVARFLNNTTNSFDSEPKVIWSMGGTFNSSYTLTSPGGKFAIRKPFASTTVETNSDRTGDDVTLSSDGSSTSKYTIYRKKTFTLGGDRNIAVSSSGISTSPTATQCWRFVSEAEVTAYNTYITACNSFNEKCGGEKPISLDLKNRIAAALTAEANYSNYNDKISAMNTLKTEYDNYIASLSIATKESPVDVTGLIKNPGYEAATWDEGWTATGFVDHSNGGKFSGSHAPEMWSADLTSGKISQTLTNLPVGTYNLSATVTGGFGGETSMYAMEEARKVAVPGINDDPVQHPVVPFVVHNDAEGANVEIGFKRDNCRYWTAVDDWTLSYYPANEYEWVNGTRLDGSYLSKPAYTTTPADGVDPDHADDALMVVTWRDNYTNDVKTPWALKAGSKAEVWVDGAKVADVDLLSDFRSSHYDNGFGLYIPNFDETKTYTIKVPENVFGYTAAGHGNEAFEVQAVASPLKDGKYFVVVKGTGKHVSRGKGWGTQAILDYYGVPMMVQTAGLTIFKFLDSNAFLGSDPTDNWLFTDIQGSEANKVRRYILIPGEGEHEGEFQFYAPSRDKYLSHVQNSINGETYDAVNEGEQADYFQFEILDAEGYAAHLENIKDDEAKRVTERAGLSPMGREAYNAMIEELEKQGTTTIFPDTDDEKTAAAKYYEKHNDELACEAVWEGTPRDLVGDDKVSIKLDKGLYALQCDAFQQAMNIGTLKQNLGFRGLTYMYVKVNGHILSKDQLKSITETKTQGYTLPTDATTAAEALDTGEYFNRILFQITEDDSDVEFGIENPQRLGNGVDETAGSWVAFKNIKVEKFEANMAEANLSVKANKYGTFVAPFAVVIPEGITAYKAKLNPSGETVHLDENNMYEAGKTLPAKTPVILKNTTGALIQKTYQSASLIDDDVYTVTEGPLIGYYKAGDDGDENTWVAKGSYALQTQNDVQAFYQITDASLKNGHYKATKNRCYLVAPNNAVKAYHFSFDPYEEDVETSITEMADQNVQSVGIYDLSGRRVSKAQKGIYVINGKKVVK